MGPTAGELDHDGVAALADRAELDLPVGEPLVPHLCELAGPVGALPAVSTAHGDHLALREHFGEAVEVPVVPGLVGAAGDAGVLSHVASSLPVGARPPADDATPAGRPPQWAIA